MAAQERHHRAAVLGQRQHRRLRTLVGEQGRQRAHQYPGRADADDRPAGPEQLSQVGRRRFEFDRRAVDPAGQAVHFGAGQGLGQAAREIATTLGQRHEDRYYTHDQASPRRCTRIMEK